MTPINNLAISFAGFGNTEYQTEVYRELVRLLDSKHPSVLNLLDSGDVVLFEGYEYRVSDQGYTALANVLKERGF